MSVSLLSTKLYKPPSRANAIARPRLTEKLLSGVVRPGTLTLLSGPAGFGKTTLLSNFMSQFKGSVAWVSLDEGDNDPVRFWSYLIAACQTVRAGVGESAQAMFQSPQPLPVETIPTILINDLAGIEASIVLVLDDFHIIQNPSIHTSFSFLLEHLPDNLHIVLSTRTDPPLPLARWRAHNRLVEVRAQDLRFNPEEAALFLNRMMGLNLSTMQVTALEERTEGWIAGLQLAAISMQNRNDASGFVKAFTGSHTYVADYLVEEVLQHQSEEIQTFLLQTSILERLNAGLCETVTGCRNGQAVLTTLQRANLFVLPLDDEGLWFRYHHLFADLLQARLQQAFPAEAITGLHRRAATWYEQHGFAIEAVNHALAARDFVLAARLVEENTYPLVTRGELATLIGWIDALPAEVTRRPQFLLAKAWALLFLADAGQIETLLGQIEAQIEPGSKTPAVAELLGSTAAIRAFFALMAGEHERALELAKRAEALLPPAGVETGQLSPYVFAAHSVLPYTLGMAYRGQGQYEQALQAFAQEVKMFAAPEDILGWTIATIEVAVLRRMQGRLRESGEICRRALQKIADQGAYPYGSLARVEATLSEALREQNELDEAYQRVTGAIERMRTWNMPTDRLSAYLTLGRIQLSRGDLAGAGETVRLAKELRATQPVFLDLSRTLDMLEIRTALTTRDIPLAARLMEVLQPGASRIVFLREQELVLLAQLRLAQGRPTEAVAILSPLVSDAEAAGGLYIRLAAQVQQALALEALGDQKAALVVLRRALSFARTEGFVGVFVDEGEAMQKLLAAAARQLVPANDAGSTALKAFIARLLEAFPAGRKAGAVAYSPEKTDDLVEPLTARELEVLQLIAAGDSNQTIADKLVITVSAVKKHTGNIFGKLSVNSRTQAIAQARQLGLLTTDA